MSSVSGLRFFGNGDDLLLCFTCAWWCDVCKILVVLAYHMNWNAYDIVLLYLPRLCWYSIYDGSKDLPALFIRGCRLPFPACFLFLGLVGTHCMILVKIYLPCLYVTIQFLFRRAITSLTLSHLWYSIAKISTYLHIESKTSRNRITSSYSSIFYPFSCNTEEGVNIRVL